jgi:two-component system alkaline phosphatase synthesis response regulator PhoP
MPEKAHHVLVVEDDVAMLGVIRFSLESVGLRVTTAKSGKAAWEVLGAGDVDVVVTDYRMPEMTGGELCERIRQDLRLAHTHVIFLTAKGFELDTTYFQNNLSVSAIIFKPFSPRELTQTVQACLAVGVAGT